MQQEDFFLIKVLASFMNGEEISELPLELSLTQLYQSARKHGVAGIVYYKLQTLLEIKTDTIVRSLKDCYLAEVFSAVQIEEEIRLLEGSLERAGIEYTFVKGYEIRNSYPVPELRTMGDVDILIAEESISQAEKLLYELGYMKKDLGGHVWTFYKEAVSLEIHKRLTAGNYWNTIDYEKYFLNFFHRLIKDPNRCRKYFKPEDHFIFLCFHLAKHLNGTGAGIRMVLDIAVYLKEYKNKMDWQYIQSECEKIALDAFAKNLLYLCQRWFGVCSVWDEAQMDAGTYHELTEYIMAGGIFGFERPDSIRRLRRGIDESNKKSAWRIKSKALLKIIFPNGKHMTEFMPEVAKHPWLLPAAWIKRWQLAVKSRGTLKTAFDGFKENTKVAVAQYELLKRIGL